MLLWAGILSVAASAAGDAKLSSVHLLADLSALVFALSRGSWAIRAIRLMRAGCSGLAHLPAAAKAPLRALAARRSET